MRSKLSISSPTRGGECAARWGSVLLPHLQEPPSRFTPLAAYCLAQRFADHCVLRFLML
nr:MAG TPA: hypothetical protein [Caudoviricetes sp.]